MAKQPKLDLSDLKTYRKALGLTQAEFWDRIGVTQSGGSRYEGGRAVPTSVAMLLWLASRGKLQETDLSEARRAVGGL